MRAITLWALLGSVACRPAEAPIDSEPDPEDSSVADSDSADTGETGAPDGDDDGYPADVDCDDDDPAVHPGAAELCNEKDDDCDAAIDEDPPTWYHDLDGDGFAGTPEIACERPDGAVEEGTDCDDAEAAVHPGATGETCADGIDTDCDGSDGCSALLGAFSVADAAARIDGTTAGTYTGARLGAVGDLDGDGRDELVIVGGQYTRYYVFAGPLTGEIPIDDADARVDVEAAYTIGPPADVDGDALADLLLADVVDDVHAVHVLRGPVLGEVGPDDAHLTVNGLDYWEFAATQGRDAAIVGDVDGDGHPDLAVGAFAKEGTGKQSGGVYLLRGPLADGTLSSAEEILGETVGDQAGNAVTPAGDIDGDGLDDFWVGADMADGGPTFAGRVYLVLGPADIGTLADADAIYVGESTRSAFGSSVATGDIDGDGHSDVAVGAPGYFNGDLTGYVYLFRGPHAGSGSAGVAAARIAGTFNGQELGRSVSLGDVDGDGLDDLLAGASANNSWVYEGAAYLYYGAFDGALTTDDADASFLGEVVMDRAGEAVSAQGDFNGDGRADLVIGAFYHAKYGTASGSTYVFYGAPR